MCNSYFRLFTYSLLVRGLSSCDSDSSSDGDENDEVVLGDALVQDDTIIDVDPFRFLKEGLAEDITTQSYAEKVIHSEGHPANFGDAMNGYGLYERIDTDGNETEDLEAFRGHYDNIREVTTRHKIISLTASELSKDPIL